MPVKIVKESVLGLKSKVRLYSIKGPYSEKKHFKSNQRGKRQHESKMSSLSS